eukprot:CAMPEP_0116963160 /NCGR_PEP_ID=MMETSP0467-20121206/47735_1 /TAXON_ID=283647 /ORGANISM="Mesodinium pulex, Strain SPMC105" /LENGTH=233 /DNA_ID=CAMNT_0004651715 /DNA_START=21 /DNA_END=722 /DNA_ORIENTATION=-
MGAGGLSAADMRGTEKEIIVLMMPVYYIHDGAVTKEDIEVARQSWGYIIEDKSPAFIENKKNPDFDQSSCISWFYGIFYERLFNVHPMCQPLFTSGLVSQGKFLVKMVSLTLNCLLNREKFQKNMEELALRHCERGVRGVEYGVVGDVLFYTLHKCLGNEAFSLETETVWKKIYSAMLSIIVPLAIEYERTGMVTKKAERATDSGGELMDSAMKAEMEEDKKRNSENESRNES